MSNIIEFQPRPYRFCVYEHKIQRDRELSVNRMIVIKNTDNLIVQFTGLEHFSYCYTGQKPMIKVRQKAELVYICNALNHIFAHNKIDRISEINSEMIFAFFDFYCYTPKGKSNEIMRSQQSLDTCIKHVTSFFCNLASRYPTKLGVEDLMNYQDTKANSRSDRIIRCFVPRYIPKRPHSYAIEQLRDMPLKAAARLVELARIHDPMIAFGIVLQLSAGLRPGCVCNMRQEDSPVSTTPCIKLSYRGSAVTGAEIDLTHEYMLRSDGVSIGRIKKERSITVCKPFLPEFMNAYTFHKQLLSGVPCEAEYKPMFIGKNGKAMTYNTYAKRVRHLVYTYLKPELYNSDDPLLSAFAHLLDSQPWGAHTLRHCFTIRLVLEGFDVAQVQHYRGDKSPESALSYIANKGELAKQVTTSHRNAIEGLAKLYNNH